MSQEAKDRYRLYLESDHWKELRKGCFFRDGKRCRHCKSSKNINAHHLRYRNLTDCYLSDVMTLCRRCHDAIHQHMNQNRIPHNVLEAEDVLSILRQLNFPPRIPATKPGKHFKYLSGREKRANALAELGNDFPPHGPGPFTITMTMIDALRTDAGGLVGPVLRALGVPHPLRSRWEQNLVGKTISKENLVFAWNHRNKKGMNPGKAERMAKKHQAKLERRRAKRERKRLKRELLSKNVVPINFKAA